MIPVDYMGYKRMFAIFKWNETDRYSNDQIIGKVYKSRGWALRKADILNAVKPIFLVRTVWVR